MIVSSASVFHYDGDESIPSGANHANFSTAYHLKPLLAIIQFHVTNCVHWRLFGCDLFLEAILAIR